MNDLWGLPETLKCHIMGSHVVEYFAMEGVTRWSTSEETGEACHKLYKRRARTHQLDNNRNVVGKRVERCLRTGFNIHNLKSFRKA